MVSIGKDLWAPRYTEGIVEETINGVTVNTYADRPKSVIETLQNSARLFPDKEALVAGSERITYGELNRRVNNMAYALRTRYGIKKGDRVAILLTNGIPFVISLYAVAQLGGICVPLNTRLKSSELEFMLNNSGSSLLVLNDSWWVNIEPIKSSIGNCREFFVVGQEIAGTRSFTELIDSDAPEVVTEQIDEHDVALIMYTSGTTGLPKGAMNTNFNVIHTMISYKRIYDLTPDDRTVIAVPLFHVTGLYAQLLTYINLGCTIALLPMYKTDEMLRILEEEKITSMIVVPTIYVMMLMHPEHKNYDLSNLRVAGFGGAPMSGETVKMLEEWLPGIELHNTYGLTEIASPGTCMPKEDAMRKLGSIGLPFPVNKCKIVDPVTGEELPPNTEGELLINSPNLTPGYWQNQEATAKAIIDGWLHTGDIAKIDEEGYVYIMDRIKDMINRGGEKIFCVEVEDVLYSNSKVMEAAVVGVPDEVFGEVVKACIVPRPGATLTEEEVQDWVRERLAKYKVPKFVQFLTELPKNPNGKVMKNVLREMHQ
ncbi:class I adenylate-forming enzyme family protein [Desulfotruncus alcoholivorax]|uniref:class I adenylate-forming enzyme family protein n=1 Tax=Desulfotruncus alcoholivorax TaxID=265477 RepID=UPI00040AF48E|nr:long-chain-fatty-acid--CoA ligase [Desulfotruncus alcoholivorax]